MALGDLLIQVRASASAFAADMKSIQREAKTLESAVKPIQKTAADIGIAFTAVGGSVVAAFVAMTKQTANIGDKLNDMRQKTGVAVPELARLGFAAEQSGSSLEGMSTGLKFLAKNMEAAGAGGKAQKAAFDSLGISVKDAGGNMKPTNEILLETADRFAVMADGSQKSTLAMQLFGRSGVDLIPTLNEGSAGLLAMGDAHDRLAGVITNDSAKAADEFNGRLNELSTATEGITLVIGNTFLPILTDFAKTASDLVVKVREWVDVHPGLIKAIGGAAAVLTGAGGLLLGISGVLLILPQLTVAFGLLTGPVGLTIIAVTALVSGIIYFRKEIATNVLRVVANMVKSFANLAGGAAKLADAMGLTGLGAKLHSAQFSIEETVVSLKKMEAGFTATNNSVTNLRPPMDEVMRAFRSANPDITRTAEEIEKASKAAKALADQMTAAQKIVSTNARDIAKDWKDANESMMSSMDLRNKQFSAQLAKEIKDWEIYFDAVDKIAKEFELPISRNAGSFGSLLEPLPPTAAIVRMPEATKEAVAALNAATEDVKRSAGAIFDAMFIKGENVFSSLSNLLKGGALSLGRSIFEDVTGSLLGPVKKAFDDFFVGLLESTGIKSFVTGLGNKLGGMLSGIFDIGGGAVSTAAGGAGSVAGGIPGIGGGASGAASGGAGAFAGLGSAVVGGLVASIGSLLSGMRLEGTMNAVEANTRFTYIELKDTMEQILWPIHNFTGYLADQSNVLVNQLDAIFNAVLPINDHIGEFVTSLNSAVAAMNATANASLSMPASLALPSGGVTGARTPNMTTYSIANVEVQTSATNTQALIDDINRSVERGSARLVASALHS